MLSDGPRVYALDMIVSEDPTACNGLFVIDVNGARAGCYPQTRLYGDDRVQEAVLNFLGEAGGGVITSVSQLTRPPVHSLFDGDRCWWLENQNCGLYNAQSAYMPVGDPSSMDAEQYASEIAGRLGIEYRKVEVSWLSEERKFIVHGGLGNPVPLRDWIPEGLLWPYSWDQRNMPLPHHVKVCNPPQYAAATTNKFLAYYLTEGVENTCLMPASILGGLWAPGSERLAVSLSPCRLSPLTMIKPLAGRRGFGVLISPSDYLMELLPSLGLVAAPEQLVMGMHTLILGSLWGEAHEFLALLQPYIQPRLLSNPKTGLKHASIVRATVVSENREEDSRPRCIDACQMLANEPHRDEFSREAFILHGSGNAGVLDLSDPERERIYRAAELFVASLEQSIATHLQVPTLPELARTEADILLEGLNNSSDAPVLSLWQQNRGFLSSCELMEALVEEREVDLMKALTHSFRPS